MTTLYVTKNLKITNYEPSGYQYRGTRAECEAYIELATQKYTPKQIREHETKFLQEKGGEKLVKSVFGKEWEQKRKKYDEDWDRIRRSRTKLVLREIQQSKQHAEG